MRKIFPIYLSFMIAVLLLSQTGSAQQQCGPCNKQPGIAVFDLAMLVPEPEIPTAANPSYDHIHWMDLFRLGKFAGAYLWDNSSRLQCVKFLQPPEYDAAGVSTDSLKVGQTYTNLPPKTFKEGQADFDYLVTGSVKPAGAGYEMTMQIETACSRKIVASSTLPFQYPATNEMDNRESVARQVADGILPLHDKIKEFELRERQQDKNVVLDGGVISVKVANPRIKSGEQTDFELEMKDCDGEPLKDKEIFFTEGAATGFRLKGTAGGTVTPARVTTDAQGKAKARFTMSKEGGDAVIHAHSVVRTPGGCDTFFSGSAAIEADVEAISIEYGYSGFAFVDATAEDCPSMRPDGREILTAQLRLVGIVDGSRRYEGTGRFSADIDGCGITPNREDPGQINGGDPGWGGFRGDNFLGCTVTTMVPDRTVRVSLRVSPPDDESPGAVDIRWAPEGPAADARVTSPCEPPWHAEHVKRLTEKYRGAARLEITDFDLMPKMLDGGALRPGTYTDPEGSSEGTWTLTVKRAQGRKP